MTATLFDLPTADQPPSLDERFAKFHADNPAVYAELHRLCVELLRQGHTRLSIAMLWEHLRLRTLLGEFGAPYRLNNSYRSRMARLLMESDPRLAGVFETRQLTDEGA